MPAPRESRNLVPLEVLAVLAIAIAPLPELVPAAVPLFVAGSLSRWARGRSWADVVRGPSNRATAGAVAGALALGFAVLGGTPAIEAIEALGGRAVEWSAHPIVRGNASLFAMVAVYAAGGRSILAPLCARLVFDLGVLFLEALRLVG